MIKIIEHLHADEGHGVRLLSDRGGDDTLLNPIKRVLVCIHCDDGLSGDVIAIEHASDFFSGLRFETDKAVNLVAFLAYDLSRRVESDPRIALNVDDASNFDFRRAGERVFVAAQTILQVRLVGHGEDDHVALALQLLRQAKSAGESRLIIVGTDEEQALARWSIGVNRDDRDAGRDRLVDAVFQYSRIGYTEQDAGRLLLHSLVQRIAFSLWIVGLRPDEIGANLELRCGVGEASSGSLPVGHLQIGGDQNVVFGGVMSAAAAERSRQQSRKTGEMENSMRSEHASSSKIPGGRLRRIRLRKNFQTLDCKRGVKRRPESFPVIDTAGLFEPRFPKLDSHREGLGARDGGAGGSSEAALQQGHQAGAPIPKHKEQEEWNRDVVLVFDSVIDGQREIGADE